MAPEVVDNRPTRGAPADLWSLGVIAYQMITGLLPFQGGSAYLTFRATLAGGQTFPAEMQPAARELVERLLVADPERRWNADDVRRCAFFAGLDWGAVPAAALSASNLALLSRLAAAPLPGDSRRGGVGGRASDVTLEDLEREFGASVVVEDGFVGAGACSRAGIPEEDENGGAAVDEEESDYIRSGSVSLSAVAATRSSVVSGGPSSACGRGSVGAAGASDGAGPDCVDSAADSCGDTAGGTRGSTIDTVGTVGADDGGSSGCRDTD
jgi:hypothetical protein